MDMRYVNLNGMQYEGVSIIGSVFLDMVHLRAFVRVIWITMHVFAYIWRGERKRYRERF